MISAVIVNYNAGLLLTACIGAALPQVDEVVIVDNASSDDSLARLILCFPDEARLRVIRNDRNLGFAAACNQGAAAAKGDAVMFLNPDCILEANAVSRLHDVLRGRSEEGSDVGPEVGPEVGMVGGLLRNPDGTEQRGARRAIPTPWRSFVRAFGLARFAGFFPRMFFDFHLHNQPLPEKPVEVEAISGACMLVHRRAMADVGPWDEGYFLHCEDLDWCMRFRQKGYRIVFVPDARITHARGVCGRARPIFVEWHKHKGMMRFYRKFFRHQYPGILMALVVLGVWMRFAASAGYYSVRHAARALGIGRG
jgi:GT2 family glycosyltransferase